MELTKSIIDNKLVFECGCEFPIKDGKLVFCADLHNPRNSIDLSCPATYKIMSDGYTQGIFQLESPLGTKWCRKLKPENIEHISALGAILRPGALECVDEEGISTTEHYCRRKNGLEEIQSYHPVMDEILQPTNSLMIYQESMIKIAQKCAGFSLSEADTLRKAVGKKLPELMAQVKKLFYERAKDFGILSEHQIEEVWGWIEKSQRYSFNKCVSGDCVINRKMMNIRDLHNTLTYKINRAKDRNKNQLYNKFRKNNHIGLALSMDNSGDLINNKIISINYSGHFEVYRVTTQDGSYIDLTLNHKIPTINGEKLLQDISPGEKIFVKLKNKLSLAEVIIESITPIGVKDTYDIEMASPYHNLCINDIIVCNSHSVCYGIRGYICAYIKTHFPYHFYKNWLLAEDDRDVYKGIADECKKAYNINIYTPNLLDKQDHFYLKGKNIYFGLLDIKGVLEKDVNKIKELISDVEIDKISWIEFLVNYLYKIGSKTAEGLIKSGSLDFYNMDREAMWNDYTKLSELTDGELKKVLASGEKINSIKDMYKCIISNKYYRNSKYDRLEKLNSILQAIENPPYNIVDTIDSLIFNEENLLSLSISAHQSDNIPSAIETNTCKNIMDGFAEYSVLKVKIDRCSEYTCRNGESAGQNMAFITMSDSSAKLDKVVAWPDTYRQYKHLLSEDKLLFVAGQLNRNTNSFIVKRVYDV